MKKILGLVVLLILVSCENHCVESYAAIVNNSGKGIEISSYKYNPNGGSAFPSIFSKKIIIGNDSKYDQTYKDCEHVVVDKYIFGVLVEGDSIVIDYGDKIKWYSYKNLADQRNPIYLGRQREANDFVYTLTTEDYANAIPKQ